MLKFKKNTFHFFLVAYCLLIFILSSIPGDKYPEVDIPSADKLVHTLIYCGLFLLFFYSLKLQSKSVNLQKYAILWSILFTAVYGATDEFHQLFTVNRSCDLIDWFADVSGALIGTGIILIILKRNYNKLPFVNEQYIKTI
ncbi:hypothetical protein BH10BAC5_BH10BAC5_00880 [soil metagenome]